MDYGNILTRTWHLVWGHKYLILLGVLAALGSGGGGFGGGSSNFSGQGQAPQNGFQFEGAPQFEGIGGLGIVVIIMIVGLLLFLGLVVWAVSRIASGGLIDAADTIDGGGQSSFGLAWQAGWLKGWRLLGIGLLPAIPVLILLFVALGAAGLFTGLAAMTDGPAIRATGGVGVILVGTACVMLPIAIVLNLLRTFADRACMLEDLSILDSYSRGWQVLSANLGPAVVLFVLQIALSIVLGIGLFLPNVIMILCCLLWPLLLLIQGAIAAYFSTMWTLAWREWTGQTAPTS